MKIEIKSRWTGAVIYTAECATLRNAVIEALRNKADLRYADLRSADLSSANLSSADLSSANLSSADLRSADLRSADLRYADLRYADLRYADLSSANLSSADLSSADLRYADLSSADLSSADLRYADLSYADLRSADLSSANLSSANLSSAIGFSRERTIPLMMLLDQPGRIRLYKLVAADYVGYQRSGLRYQVGDTPEVLDANTDISEPCAAGVNVAALDWCLREWRPGLRVMIVEFEAADIACIPIGTDGKLRLYRCTVVAEKDLSGLVPENDTEETK